MELNEQLLEVVQQWRPIEAIALLSRGADIGYANADGMTALMCATLRGRTRMVRLLLEQGAEVNHINNAGMTALMIAAMKGHVKTMRILIEHKANVNYARNGITALTLAASQGNTEAVTLLREHSAEFNPISDLAMLIEAANEGHTHVVRLLVNCTDNQGNSALIIASVNGDTEMVRMLIEHKIDVNRADNNGDTALTRVSANGNKEMVELLIEHGADINHTTNNHGTALTIASENNHPKIVELLLRYGVIMPAEAQERNVIFDAGSITSLRRAVIMGDRENVNQLLNQRTTLVSRVMGYLSGHASHTHTLLHWAIAHNNHDLAQFLLNKGFNNINVQDEQGNTPLHYALRNGNGDIIGLLLDRNAEVNSKNNQKNTPLHLAAQAGTIAVVKRLMKAGACVTAPNSQAYTAWGVALRHNHNELADLIDRHAVQATLRLVSKQGGLGKTWHILMQVLRKTPKFWASCPKEFFLRKLRHISSVMLVLRGSLISLISLVSLTC